MDEINQLPTHILYQPPISDYHRHEHDAIKVAQRLFERARLRSRIQIFWCWLAKRSYQLFDLSALNAYSIKRNCHYAGIRSVPICKIRGSEGRSSDFSTTFFPLHLHLRARWETIAALLLMGETLPAVELIQVGNIYFVRDGHHRISVSRELGAEYIDAEVTVLEVYGSLPCEPCFEGKVSMFASINA